MKISKSRLEQIIREAIDETTGRFSTPPPDEGGDSPILNAKNKVTAAIAALTMLAADTDIPIKNLQRTIDNLQKVNRMLHRKHHN